MDDGPIIGQAAVPVLTGDTPEALAARVLAAEHKLYPAALALVAHGQAKLNGNAVELQPAVNAEVNQDQVLSSPFRLGTGY
jgi:phosphoribosylglycinamide formyltransferase-1